MNKRLVGKGYSGIGAGRDKPAMQCVHNVGPIPQGAYEIGTPHDTTTHGPYEMRLTSKPYTVTYGRAGFRIHGDNKRHDASHGGIILARDLRIKAALAKVADPALAACENAGTAP